MLKFTSFINSSFVYQILRRKEIAIVWNAVIPPLPRTTTLRARWRQTATCARSVCDRSLIHTIINGITISYITGDIIMWRDKYLTVIGVRFWLGSGAASSSITGIYLQVYTVDCTAMMIRTMKEKVCNRKEPHTVFKISQNRPVFWFREEDTDIVQRELV